MELNLNELERRAKSAGGQEWTLTIDATGDAFLSAENSEYVAEVGAVGEDGIVSDYGKFIAAANPAVVLELVRRLREAEARVAELEAERAEREKQEPVAYLTANKQMLVFADKCVDMKHLMTPLYADPPVTAPVRLTNDQVGDCIADCIADDADMQFQSNPIKYIVVFARAVEAAVLRANGFKVEE